MINKKLPDKIGSILLLTVGLVVSIMQIKNEEPLLHYVFYSYDKVVAKVIDFENQDAAGYFSSRAIIEYEYKNKQRTSHIELVGVTLGNKEGNIDVYVSKKDNNILTTKTNLLYSVGSISLTLFLSVFWLLSFIKLVRMITTVHSD